MKIVCKQYPRPVAQIHLCIQYTRCYCFQLKRQDDTLHPSCTTEPICFQHMQDVPYATFLLFVYFRHPLTSMYRLLSVTSLLWQFVELDSLRAWLRFPGRFVSEIRSVWCATVGHYKPQTPPRAEPQDTCSCHSQLQTWSLSSGEPLRDLEKVLMISRCLLCCVRVLVICQ